MSQFYQMLDELNAATESKRNHLKEKIWNTFGIEKAVFVLDMSRYSSTIYIRGVFHSLRMIRKLRSAAGPIIQQFKGEILEQKADNLLVIFDQPLEAVNAAAALNRTFDKVNRSTPELENIYIKVGIDFGKFLCVDDVGFFGLPINLASKLVADAAIDLLAPYQDKVFTITSDNGKEFADHQQISKQLTAEMYFAHPYHSWERGLNENTNGLIRQYFPKDTDFKSITIESVRNVMNQLNNRPRKTLDYATPNEVFFGKHWKQAA